MQAEERRHGRERGADQHGSTIPTSRSNDRESDSRPGGSKCTEADAGEMEHSGKVNLMPAEKMEQCDRHRGRGGEQGESGNQPQSHKAPYRPDLGKP